jgi:hypothetical protein
LDGGNLGTSELKSYSLSSEED